MKTVLPEPATQNDFLADYVEMLCRCHKLWMGHELVDPSLSRLDAAFYVYTAPYAVLAHDASVDPVFTYANQTALKLFDVDWPTLMGLPSRLSAEPINQEARQRLLDEVTTQGYIAHYSGVRISRTQKRFQIDNATVWNLVDPYGHPMGQAAMFAQWLYL